MKAKKLKDHIIEHKVLGVDKKIRQALFRGDGGGGDDVLGAIATHAALTTGIHGLAITAGQTLTVTTGGTLTSTAYTAIGTSGATVPLLSTANTWTLAQTYNAGIKIPNNFFIQCQRSSGGSYINVLGFPTGSDVLTSMGGVGAGTSIGHAFVNTAGTNLLTIDGSGLNKPTGLVLPNSANPSLTNSGQVAVNTTDKTLEVNNGANQVSFPTIHLLQGTLDLATAYDVDSDIWLLDLNADTFPHGIYITKIYLDSSVADPTTEIDGNLMYCDAVGAGAFPGANATLIKAIDTTTGNFADAAVNTAIPTGKSIYIDLDADPVDANTVYHFRIHYYVPTA